MDTITHAFQNMTLLQFLNIATMSPDTIANIADIGINGDEKFYFDPFAAIASHLKETSLGAFVEIATASPHTIYKPSNQQLQYPWF